MFVEVGIVSAISLVSVLVNIGWYKKILLSMSNRRVSGFKQAMPLYVNAIIASGILYRGMQLVTNNELLGIIYSTIFIAMVVGFGLAQSRVNKALDQWR